MSSYTNETSQTKFYPDSSIRKINTDGVECLSDHLLPGETILLGDGQIDPVVTTAPDA